MEKILISLSMISLFLFSCDDSFDDKAKKQNETVNKVGHHHDSEIQNIELDKGEKWKVTEKMLVIIRAMESDITALPKVYSKDYKLLSKKLQKNIDLLTSNCTMTGKAHDELHKWLLPFIALTIDLSEAKDIKNQENCFQKLEESFVLFNTYFN